MSEHTPIPWEAVPTQMGGVLHSTSYGPSSVRIIRKPNYVVWFALALSVLALLAL